MGFVTTPVEPTLTAVAQRGETMNDGSIRPWTPRLVVAAGVALALLAGTLRIVLVSDIAREVIGRNRAPSRTHLCEVMAKPALSLDAEMNIRYAVRLMDRLGLTHAVVLDDRRLVGIVTLRDLVLRHIEAMERPAAAP